MIFDFTAWVELEETYELSAVNTLQDAVNTILKFLGLAADTGSGKVNQGVHTHTLLCSGKFQKKSEHLLKKSSTNCSSFSCYRTLALH